MKSRLPGYNQKFMIVKQKAINYTSKIFLNLPLIVSNLLFRNAS